MQINHSPSLIPNQSNRKPILSDLVTGVAQRYSNKGRLNPSQLKSLLDEVATFFNVPKQRGNLSLATLFQDILKKNPKHNDEINQAYTSIRSIREGFSVEKTRVQNVIINANAPIQAQKEFCYFGQSKEKNTSYLLVYNRNEYTLDFNNAPHSRNYDFDNLQKELLPRNTAPITNHRALILALDGQVNQQSAPLKQTNNQATHFPKTQSAKRSVTQAIPVHPLVHLAGNPNPYTNPFINNSTQHSVMPLANTKGVNPSQTDPFSLQRFNHAQQHGLKGRSLNLDRDGTPFSTALKEVRNGKKSSHWIWYTFPTKPYSNGSLTNQYFAIKSDSEAKDFLLHTTLRKNYLDIIKATQIALKNKPLSQIYGSDAKKVRSSLDYFLKIAKIIADIEVVNTIVLCQGENNYLK